MLCLKLSKQLWDRVLRHDIELADPALSVLPREEWPDVTPTSRVHASDDQWFDLVGAGLRRGILQECPEDEVFCDGQGQPVLAGAMGVDKPTLIEGKMVLLMRFIAILVPINSFMRDIRANCEAV